MKITFKITITLLSVFILPFYSLAGNLVNDSFSKAKRMLEQEIYFDHRETIYCAAVFDEKKYALPLDGFESTKYKKRAKRIEWEHVVPAENFGRTFIEWRDGDKQCINRKGKSFKGRKCAEKTNEEYRLMQADMFNLYPAIGSVNALRSNYNFTVLPNVASDFGSCLMKIDNKKAQPPLSSRGRISRTYLYMESVYPRYKMSKQQRKLMTSWSKTHPVTRWECTRAKRITLLQKNENNIVKSHCKQQEIW